MSKLQLTGEPSKTMSFNGPVYFLCLVFGTTNGVEWSFVLNTITSQDKIYDFDNFLIFSSKNLIDKDFPYIYKDLMMTVGKPTVLINTAMEMEARLNFDKNSLSIIVSNNVSDTIMHTVDNMLRGLRTNKSIFIFFNINTFQIKTMVIWFWKRQFINTLLIYGKAHNETKIRTFKPYPSMRDIDITHEPIDRFFVENIGDFEGYELRVPIKNDIPRILLNGDENSTDLSGLIGKVFVVFLEHNNISLKNTASAMKSRSKGIDMVEIFNMFLDDELEMSVHIYTLLETKVEGEKPVVAMSYPVEIIKWCLMVPLKNEISKSMYIVFPFQLGVWMTVFGSVLYVSVIFKLLGYFNPSRSNIDNFLILTTAIAFVFNINGFKKAPHNPSMMMFAICGMLFAFGFVITNMYMAYLSSFLTVTVFGKQINSLEDIVKENLTIQSLSHTHMYMKNALNLSDFMLQFFQVEDDIDRFTQNRDLFNTAFGYPITTDRWKFLQIQQKQLTHKRFRLSDICFANVFSAYMMKYDSHLQRPLEHFIMKARDAGLFSHWEGETFDLAMNKKFIKMLRSEEEEKAFTVLHFHLLFLLLLFSWALGTVLLVVENMIRRCKSVKVLEGSCEEEVFEEVIQLN